MTLPPPGPKEHHYPPVGKCIYCGCDDPNTLTDEHIFPFSLGGNLVLDKASCKACNRVTHKFEQVVARDIFGRFRIKHKIQTRRPKERPKTLTIGTLTVDGKKGSAEVPAEMYPAPLFLYKFTPAGIINGAPPMLDTFGWVPYNAWSGDLDGFKKEFNWDGIIRILPVPRELARMLAKIAYSYAVAEFGLDCFTPIANDVILCRSNNVGYLVGGRYPNPTGSNDDLEAPQADKGHIAHFTVFANPEGRFLLAANIRLFASVSSCTYHAVIGEFHRDSQIAALLQKPLNTQVEEGPFPFI